LEPYTPHAHARSFIGLFIAVIIHQLLEGLGVGAAAVEGQFSFRKLNLLASCFGLTAPIGIALGVALHASLNTNDPRLLMTLGVVVSL
jgi:solute carrier family 39 (zinc transporter), member 1/2/3